MIDGDGYGSHLLSQVPGKTTLSLQEIQAFSSSSQQNTRKYEKYDVFKLQGGSRRGGGGGVWITRSGDPSPP